MVYAVGLMSGTSLDGIDAVLVDISGKDEQTIVKMIAFVTVPFTAGSLQRIREVLSVDTATVEKICSLNVELGELFADAVGVLCQKAQVSLKDLSFIASHGQTIYHIPEKKEGVFASTLQIGDPAILCERTQTTVVSNFRERDIAVGGQGAPIVPYSEYVLYRSETHTRLLQNIGGIGNVTVIPKKAALSDIIAFDTGPGNVIMNELCLYFYQEPYDKDGLHAKKGTVHPDLLAALMRHPYLQRLYPKTTGWETFGKAFVHQLLADWSLPSEDFIASATMFTACSIAQAIAPFITEDTELIIGGGGSYNPVLLSMLQEQLPTISVVTQEVLGASSEAKEAIAVTILANQTLQQLPSNVPSATGANRQVPLGSITFYDT